MCCIMLHNVVYELTVYDVRYGEALGVFTVYVEGLCWLNVPVWGGSTVHNVFCGVKICCMD